MPALAVAAVATVASSAISANSANRAAKAQKRAAGEAMEVANDIAQEDLGTQKELESLMQGRLNEARSSTQSAVRGAADAYNTKADEALGALNAGYSSAVDETKSGYGQARADLQPYADTGSSALDRLYKTYITGENSYTATDPGYAFRLAEGQKALERSAAARGGLYSGATGKALTNYAQGAASQEFQNSYSRLLPLANMGLQTAGQMSNLAVGQGRDLATLAAGQGRDVAGIRQNQGGFLADLAMKDGMIDLSINNGRNEITNAYGARTSSILQNLSRAMQSGQQAYGDASAAGTLGVGGAIGSGISTLGNLALLGGSNLFGSSSNLGRVGYSSGVVNSQTGRMIGGV